MILQGALFVPSHLHTHRCKSSSRAWVKCLDKFTTLELPAGCLKWSLGGQKREVQSANNIWPTLIVLLRFFPSSSWGAEKLWS